MDDQFDLWNISSQAPATQQASSNDPDAFGCCSRYHACSNAKKCLIPERSYSAHCTYRKKLESGIIFYGENANDFSMERYKALLSAINSLPDSSRRTLDNLVIDVLEYHRAATHAVVRSDCLDGLPELCLFDFSPLDSTFLKKCNFRRLSSLVSGHPKYGPLFRQAQKDGKGKKPSPTSKDFLIAWLNQDGLPLREELFSPYCIARVHMASLRYLEKYYVDTLLASCDSRIYPRSPFAEDGLLSDADFAAEEQHRIAMSMGYSDAEKKRLTSSLLEGTTSDTGCFEEDMA